MCHAICLGVLALAAAPGATRADCPAAADMAAEGIRFTVATGDVEVVKRGQEEGQTISCYGSDGYLSVVRLAHGVYPVEIAQLDGGLPSGVPQRFSYGDAPLPVPAPGLQVSFEVTVTGEQTQTERHDYSFGQPVTWTLGDCAYEMIPVTARHFRAGEEVTREVAHYLPEFGHSYLALYSDGQGEEVYTYVRVEAVR
ncbi:hypothetical protein [Vannielia litorea]|uniref:hypothetical protein n=1 Tax=Vannielia litorea TaxID=1217970 RepID=UPI001BCEB843|nr:hypothetical protein [Vannielia litorea]MBS8225856.1 hypothetical protein [Vannielia litorea]